METNIFSNHIQKTTYFTTYETLYSMKTSGFQSMKLFIIKVYKTTETYFNIHVLVNWISQWRWQILNIHKKALLGNQSEMDRQKSLLGNQSEMNRQVVARKPK